MKALDIAFKDIKHSFQSFSAVMFMFGVPILVTGMFFLMFGGGGNDEEAAFSLPQIAVQVVNLDSGQLGLGETLAGLLAQEELADLLAVSRADTEEAARAAVDRQEAGAAVIIPADFSDSLAQPGARAEVEIYADPDLTIGPGIVSSLVTQFLDAFSGSKIALEVAEANLALSPAERDALVNRYIEAVSGAGGSGGSVVLETPGGERGQSGIASILTPIMGGMMIFYAFFTGANSTLSFLSEEEAGTLPRLFTTPTPVGTVLSGKFLAVFVTIVVQIGVLLVFGNLVFDIDWGAADRVALFGLFTAASATTFGIFLISMVKDTRQAGMVIAAGVTVTGILGMSGIFMLNSPNPSQVVGSMTLLVPQGWANRALMQALSRADPQQILLSLGGLLVWSVVFFVVGSLRFKRRYA